MTAAGGGVRPIGRAVTSRHDHALLMTIDTKRLFLVTGVTIIFIAFGIHAVIIDIIQRMHFPIQIVHLMADQAIIFSMTGIAGILLGVDCHPMFGFLRQIMIDWFQIFPLLMADKTIISLAFIFVTFGAGCHVRQMFVQNIFTFFNSWMAVLAS